MDSREKGENSLASKFKDNKMLPLSCVADFCVHVIKLCVIRAHIHPSLGNMTSNINIINCICTILDGFLQTIGMQKLHDSA